MKVTGAEEPEGMVPLVGLSETQDCAGGFSDQEPSPPLLISVTTCGGGLTPVVVVKESEFGLRCIENWAI